ncbi:hypothetical protein [Actinokineospora enzanensis]|uniref:hypothetical protein n=1 Tax=Actinokineospora enzanensis TaxID=155975 RepID=UPI00039D95F3|nr:hypothetical protein [Actinokineospora enzanensis]
MPIFGKSKSVVCPVCTKNLGRAPNMALHNASHVLPAEDGGPGFMWRCGCGEYAGVWDQKTGAIISLTAHMEKRHQIRLI